MCAEGCPYNGQPYQANLKGRRKRSEKIDERCRDIHGSNEEGTLSLQLACTNDIRFIPAIPDIIREDQELERRYLEIDAAFISEKDF